MSTISFTASALAYSFSYALLYSLWQGLLVFALLYMLLRAFPGTSARLKYYFSFSAFATVALWFAYTWMSRYITMNDAGDFAGSQATGATSAILVSLAGAGTVAGQPDTILQYLALVEDYFPTIVLCYCIGLVFMLLRFIVNVVQLRSLSSRGIQLPGAAWIGFTAKWQQRFGISRQVQLFMSERVSVPMMLGALKPVILLPVAAVNSLSVAQVEAILLHELAHIKRQDYLLNLVQVVVETILFFNPFIWLISAVIRREREHCCDDLVIAAHAEPLQYASALALLEDNRIKNNSLSLAATGSRNQLFNRIKRIMEMKKDNITHSRLSVLLVAVIATTFLAAMISFTPSFAQKKDDKTTTQKKTYKTVTVDDAGKKNVVKKTTTTTGKSNPDAKEDVDIKISIRDDDQGNTKAKVRVITSNKDTKDTRQVKKEVVISSANGSFDREQLEREMAKVREAFDGVDWDEIGAEVANALAEVGSAMVDVEKLSKEIRIQVKRELEDSKREIAEARKEVMISKREIARSERDVNRSMRELEKAERDVVRSERAVAEARREVDRSNREMDAGDRAAAGSKREKAEELPDEKVVIEHGEMVEEMLHRMHKDGLIDRSEKFKVEKREDALYINGKKQPESVFKKYQRYIKGEGTTVVGDRNTVNIVGGE